MHMRNEKVIIVAECFIHNDSCSLVLGNWFEIAIDRAQEILISKSVQPSDDVIGDIRTCIVIH